MYFITITTSTMSITIILCNIFLQHTRWTTWSDHKAPLKELWKKMIVLWKASYPCNTSNSITTTIIACLPWETGLNKVSLWGQRMRSKPIVMMYSHNKLNLLVLIKQVMPCSAEVSLAVLFVITSLHKTIISLTGPSTIKYLDHLNLGMLHLVDRVKVRWYKISLLCTITDHKMFLNGNQLYNRYLTHRRTLTCWLNSKLSNLIPTRIT
jgi:hypothetical protein